MKNQIKNYGNIIALFLMFSSLISYAQVGIGTSNPDDNSSLDLRGGSTNNKGFVLPLALSTEPFNASNPKGTLLYNETDSLIYYLMNPNTTPQIINALSPWFYNPAGPADITTTKNVGIGTTTPKSKLDVEGGVAIGDNYSGTSAAPTNGMIVEGKVGIGTTTPKSKLDVDGGVAIGSNYSGTNLAPTNRMIVEGSVGIGKNSPAHKLDVVGDINSSIKIKEGGNDLIPAGVIVMWSGTTAPDGWALCDGGGTRPNLKGRFIVGYDPGDTDYNNVTEVISTAKIGGSKTHNHSIPAHKHTMDHDHQAFNVTIPSSIWGNGDKEGCAGAMNGANDEYLKWNADGVISVNPPNYTGDAAGSVISYTGVKPSFSTVDSDNRPPFYTLAYIIKL